MSTSYDIIAIGSGHNGLVAAAYLAAGGKQVLVLERQPWLGGGVTTRELTLPGFRHDQHSMAHIFIQGNPLLRNDELGLVGKYGLKYVFPDMPFISVFADGSTIALYRDRQKNHDEIARISKRDAEAYLRLSELGAKYLPMLMASLYSPPLPLGAMYAMLDQSAEGRELFAIMQKSKYEIITEWFENEKVRLHFLRIASENLVAPEEKGTGIGVFFFLGFLEKYGLGVPVGGSGTLTAALVRCIEDKGGTVMPAVDVDRVTVRDGRAVGVHTVDGRVFVARDAVIGAIHPHVLGDMVAGLDPKLVDAARRTRTSSIACFTVHAAFNAPLQFRAGARVNEGYMVELLPDSMDAFRRHFDELRYGRLPEQALIGLASPSAFDPGRVPAGRATMHAWDYVPYGHPDGGPEGWDAGRTSFAERMLDRMSAYIGNLGDIAAYHADSPLDMERTSASFRRGDLAGIAPNAYQFGAHRPIPELGQFTVPGVKGLYLVGPFQHPGGGVHGGGRATAIRMFDDLKLNFDRIGQRK